MLYMKHAGLKCGKDAPVKARKRYGTLRPLKPCCGSLVAAFGIVQVDKPPPGFADRLMRRLRHGCACGCK